MADCEILVVGGGAIGAAAGRALAARGRQVTVLERWAPGHDRGSSHGDGRIIRYSYTESHYVALAVAAYREWAALEAACGHPLIVTTGGLDLAPGSSKLLDDLAAGLEEREVAFERLGGRAFARRFPQIDLPAGSEALFQADGGVVRADLALEALWRQAAVHGASMVTGAEVKAIEASSGGVRVETANGRSFRAERAILAAGAWSRDLVAQLGLELDLRVTREQLAYFRTRRPPGGIDVDDDRHRADGMPTIIDYHSEQPFYALPQVTARGTKCGWHRTGPVVDAESPRRFEPSLQRAMRDWVRDRLPGLDPEPLEELTCLYTNTADHDFIIDRHPRHPQVTIAAGFSGHGFKFVPAIGALIADLATDIEPDLPIGAFRVDRPKPDPNVALART